MRIATRLVTLLLAGGAVTAGAAVPMVLYETGWEATPATPAWVAGAVSSQNGWLTAGLNPDRLQVTVDGSPEATVFGTAYTTPAGNQMMRFTASASTATKDVQYAWPDITTAFAARPAGHDLLLASLDMLVPAGGAADASAYGLLAFADMGNSLPFGVLASPSGRVLSLVGADGETVGTASAAFAYDTWFNLAVEANFQTGEILVRLNGVAVPGLTGTNAAILGSILEDVDLYCENALGSPNPRVVFADNYRVTVQPVPVGPPANDAWAQAQLVAGLAGITNGTTFAATAEANEPRHAGVLPVRSAWYRWVAPVTGWMTFDTLPSRGDTVLAIYTGTSLASLGQAGSNDDAAPGSVTQSRASFAATAGNTYHIVVDSRSTVPSTFFLRWRPTIQLVPLPTAGNQLTLRIMAAAPGSYQVQSSSNLLAWQTFTNVSFPDQAGGTLDYNVGSASTPARRFFRVIQ